MLSPASCEYGDTTANFRTFSTSNPTLEAFVESLSPINHYQWAARNYRSTLDHLIRTFQLHRCLDVGGGRRPLLEPETIEGLNLVYKVVDIDENELRLAPSFYDTECLDISAKTIPDRQYKNYDLIFSKMVFEHIKDTKQAYQNIYEMLDENGIFLNYHPVLYAPQFMLNKIMPEIITRSLLNLIDFRRNTNNIPKFPAFYSNCVVSPKFATMLYKIGFREVEQIPFWGTKYFDQLPVLGALHSRFTKLVRTHRNTRFAAFSYTLGRK